MNNNAVIPSPPGGDSAEVRDERLTSWFMDAPLMPQDVRIEKVESDAQALKIWLESYSQRSAHTVRSYYREARRFLLWIESRKGASDQQLPAATVSDANAYVLFLAAPGQFDTRLLQKYGFRSQPFVGGLSRASVRQALVILHGMFEALRNIRGADGTPYILMNPFVLVRRQSGKPAPQESNKALSPTEWAYVLVTLDELPQSTRRQSLHKARCRWLFALLYSAMLRRHEVAALTMGSFVQDSDGWKIELTGKGQKKARIIARNVLLEELIRYRKVYGLPPLPMPGETRPALSSIAGRAPLSGQSIYAICTTIFAKTADRVMNTDPAAATRLRRAAPQWIRHTGITHALESDVAPRYVQSQARHSSLTVTATYDHKDEKRWREQLNNLWKERPPAAET